MTTKTKTNAREQLINFVLAHGWELDPTKATRGRDIAIIQDPHAFRKPAANGGYWQMELDYNIASSFYQTDNRLRQITIQLRDADNKLDAIGAGRSRTAWVRLDSRSGENYGSSLSYQLYVVTSGISDTTTLKQRAEVIAVNPDLVMWLAEEGRVNYELRQAELKRKREEEMRLRRRPLDITISREDWDKATDQLYTAAIKLNGAHGLTDLHAHVEAAETALAKLRSALRVMCDRHGGPWGSDATCEKCCDEEGTPREICGLCDHAHDHIGLLSHCVVN